MSSCSGPGGEATVSEPKATESACAREMASLVLDQTWRYARVLVAPEATRSEIAEKAEVLLRRALARLAETTG